LRNMPTRAPWAVLQYRSIDNVMLMQVERDLLHYCNINAAPCSPMGPDEM
jgi:hypothetical protein